MMAFLSPLARYVLRVVPLLLAFFCMSLGGANGIGATKAAIPTGSSTSRPTTCSTCALVLRSAIRSSVAIPPSGRGVRLLGHCREWCPVSYNGASGWVNPIYLAAEPQAQRDPDDDEPAVLPRARGYVALEPPAARKRVQLPSYWQVTGVAEGESLRVHDAPSPTASVVHAFEPQTRAASSSPADARSRGAR